MLKLLIVYFLALCAVELISETKLAWRVRKFLSYSCIVLVLIFISLMLLNYQDIAAVLILILMIYRIINLIKLSLARIEPIYLRRVALRTSLYLISFQIVVFVTSYICDLYSVQLSAWLYIMLLIVSVTLATLLNSSLRNFKKTRPSHNSINIASGDLPSLSVAIPARNESEDLIRCLDSLIASDYPKLEIVVLDDCSQNKHTPQIIKDYAHNGVRFIAGQEPPKDWQAKTYAYKQLADQVNGEYLLFCGVDTRFSTNTISLMVKEMLLRNKQMASFLPVNKYIKGSWLKSVLIQPCRYFWELALPRRIAKRPPVLSTCWIINRAFIMNLGSFDAVKRSVTPESYFAKNAIKTDAYSFLQSSDIFGLVSDKQPNDQSDTAIRTRYPQMHKRPELVAILTLCEIAMLLVPISCLIYGLLHKETFMVILSGLNIAGLNLLYAEYVNLTYQRFFYSSILLMPLAFIQDILLLNYSMYRYEFKQVIWKGRNICLPVMRSLT